MYIIEEGKAYLVDGEVAHLVNFDTTGKMLVDKDKKIDATDKNVYSFEEMYAKLNIAYMINQLNKKNASDSDNNEEIKKLNSKIVELTKENEKLKMLIAELQKTEEVESNHVEEKQENKKNKK